MTLPTFFIIGAANAGTASLHDDLDQHPQIQMSSVKEPHFFAGPENGIPGPPGRIDSLEKYERLFDPTFDVRGEASQSYTNFPRRKGVPERIQELVPDAKFLYLVRDPIARTVAHYQHSVASGKECRPLQDVLRDFSYPYSYLTCHSLYARQLELYLRRFSEEQVMVIDQAELLAERQSTLHKIFAFLSVDDTFACKPLDAGPRGGSARWRTGQLPRRIRRSARHPFGRVFRSPLQTPALDEESRARLVALYAGEVERLRALTGKAFSTWSI